MVEKSGTGPSDDFRAGLGRSNRSGSMGHENDTNVGLGMVSHGKKCRCDECEIERLQAENERLIILGKAQVRGFKRERNRAEAAESRLAKLVEGLEKLPRHTGSVSLSLVDMVLWSDITKLLEGVKE